MDSATVQILSRLTRDFYDESAVGFIAARELLSRGRLRVLDLLKLCLPTSSEVSVLDVGCGNGRLALFLERSLGLPFRYLGLDASPPLIALARERCGGTPSARFEVLDFVERDIEHALNGDTFSLVVAFGIIHHIPSFWRRRALIEALCRRVAPGGMLAISTWRVISEQYFQRAVFPWADYNSSADLPVDVCELETGDYLIAPPSRETRYCHMVEEGEMTRFYADIPLSCQAVFSTDGQNEQLNQYIILQRRPAAR